MIAKNTIPSENEVQVSTEVSTIKNELLITEDMIKPKFSHLKTKIDALKQYAQTILIEDEQGLTIAENNSSAINQVITESEELRKGIKEPYFRTSKMIDETFKVNISDPSLNIKKSINDAIKNFKVAKAAQERIEDEKRQKEISDLADKKAIEAEKITRIQSQLFARLYGGGYKNKDNKEFIVPGCNTLGEIKDLEKIVKTKLPTEEEFKYMVDEFSAMKKSFLKKLSEHKANITESSSESSVIKNNAIARIKLAKQEAGIEIVEKKEELVNTIISEAKHDMKQSEKQVQEASKGIRSTLQFEISDVSEVPLEWLILDDKKVRDWASLNKESIKEKLKNGQNIIKGIKFSIIQTNISR
jgi:hypothetical protein